MLKASGFAELYRMQQQGSKLFHGAQKVPGLPGIGGLAKKPMTGATSTLLGVPVAMRPVVEVMHQPSLKVLRQPDGSVITVIERKSANADLVQDEHLVEFNRVLQLIVQRAKMQSQGPLSQAMLNAMGNPYGRNAKGKMRGKIGNIGHIKGLHGGVPNLTVTNKQTGRFANAWHSDLLRVPGGVQGRLINDMPYAGYLALGTIYMQAHGAFTSAVNAYLTELNNAWRAGVRKAVQQHNLEQQAMASVARQLGVVN